MVTKHIYSTPAVEVMEVAVEQGFAATSLESGGEGGHWGGKLTSSYAPEENEY